MKRKKRRNKGIEPLSVTCKNHGPASLLGAESGGANALYSAPKHLIDPKFALTCPHLGLSKCSSNNEVEWALRSSRGKKKMKRV